MKATHLIFPSCLLFAFACINTAVAQRSIQEKFNDDYEHGLQEKIFVHTDKELYLTGESLWFSIYAVDGMLHKPLDLSKAAYIEMLGKDQTRVLQARIKLDRGRGNGMFDLPDLVSGHYTLRAYTRWMRNFPEGFFFEKTITIINATQASQRPSEVDVNSDECIINFFPEGGSLVESVNGKVAFEARDSHGNGVDVTGYIENNVGDTVVRFASAKFGRGTFDFKPEPAIHYRAVVNCDGKVSTHAIPAIHEHGYALQLHDLLNGKLHFVIATGTGGTDTLVLIGHTRRSVKVVMATVMREGKAGFLIDKSKLGDGISHFTVFNSKHQPVCERLYFSPPDTRLVPAIKLSNETIKRRQKVSVSINIQGTGEKSSAATLSLSVFKLDSLTIGEIPSIANYLLLSSDIEGGIENPDYYLNGDDEGSRQAADNLMLTRGWTRSSWADVLDEKPNRIRFSPEHEGIVLSGSIEQGRMLRRPGWMCLSFAGRHPRFYASAIDDGRFEMLLDDLTGNREGILQPSIDMDRGNVVLDDPFVNITTPRKPLPFWISENWRRSYLLNAMHSQSRQYFEKENFLCEPYALDTMAFYGRADKSYLMDDYQRFPLVEDIMREYIPEVMVNKQGQHSNLFVLNRHDQSYFNKAPLVLLDGVPFADNFRIAAMPAGSLKKVEVVAQPYWLGSVFFNGIINLSTVKGDLSGVELDSGAIAFDFHGYQQPSQYHSIAYDVEESRKSRIPDFRTLIYWDPQLEINSPRGKHIEFYTSDETGTFIGVLQGISESGVPLHKTFTFTIDRN